MAPRRSSFADSACTMSSGRSGSFFMSGHGLRAVELGTAPLLAGEHLPQLLHRIPHVLETGVQRREAEAQDVRRAEVADDAARDERLHDRVRSFAAGQAHLRSTLLV